MKLEVVFNDGKKASLDNVAGCRITEEQRTSEECNTSDVVHIPTARELFEVNPSEIDRSKFEKTIGDDDAMKWMWQIINEAFAEVDKNPEKYASTFYTLIPELNWNCVKSSAELKRYAESIGGYIPDWVEQVLEWAQRICNGESWQDIYIVGLGYPNAYCLASYVSYNRGNSNGNIYYFLPKIAFKNK